MLHSGLCHIWDYVTFGIMLHSGLCHIRDYVTFGIMLLSGLCHIRDYFAFVNMLHSWLCCIRNHVVWDYVAWDYVIILETWLLLGWLVILKSHFRLYFVMYSRYVMDCIWMVRTPRFRNSITEYFYIIQKTVNKVEDPGSGNSGKKTINKVLKGYKIRILKTGIL